MDEGLGAVLLRIEAQYDDVTAAVEVLRRLTETVTEEKLTQRHFAPLIKHGSDEFRRHLLAQMRFRLDLRIGRQLLSVFLDVLFLNFPNIHHVFFTSNIV